MKGSVYNGPVIIRGKATARNENLYSPQMVERTKQTNIIISKILSEPTALDREFA